MHTHGSMVCAYAYRWEVEGNLACGSSDAIYLVSENLLIWLGFREAPLSHLSRAGITSIDHHNHAPETQEINRLPMSLTRKIREGPSAKNNDWGRDRAVRLQSRVLQTAELPTRTAALLSCRPCWDGLFWDVAAVEYSLLL